MVINKCSNDYIIKSILDISNYKSNPSNILQINWKKEFNTKFLIMDNDYKDKINTLLTVIQKSIKDQINNSIEFSVNATLRIPLYPFISTFLPCKFVKINTFNP